MINKQLFKKYALIMFKGMLMGAADVVPGVSGGTIAFITGIYDEFLSSLKNCTPAALLMWRKQGFMAMWRHINGGFLLALFSGILISLKTFAALITLALNAYPVWVWAFFFGLIVASVILLARHVPHWRGQDVLAMLLGTAFVVAISLASPGQLPGYWWVMFLGGFVAMCAMILPGISGSFILLLVGLYPVFLGAINDMQLLLLASFGLGAMAGIMSFSRVLSWLLSTYHQITIAALIGFLVGSLHVTWPWKQALVTTLNHHGEIVVLQSANVLPSNYLAATGSNPDTLISLLFAGIGVLLVLTTELLAKKIGKV